MTYRHTNWLTRLWWTIKWAFIRNKRVETPSVPAVKEYRFAYPPMDLRLPYDEDLSDGALD